MTVTAKYYGDPVRTTYTPGQGFSDGLIWFDEMGCELPFVTLAALTSVQQFTAEEIRAMACSYEAAAVSHADLESFAKKAGVMSDNKECWLSPQGTFAAFAKLIAEQAYQKGLAASGAIGLSQ